jgi:nitrite reductase/ring-hydroxylating ferredoxin subunit
MEHFPLSTAHREDAIRRPRMREDRSRRLAERWFSVARSEEIVERHIFQTQLLGQEVAIWRDDTGLINAWENRCPHRGVRLSIGINTGAAVRCQYHGFRYATQTGQCTFIPAHPNQIPPNVIRAISYACTEQYGFVWIKLAGNAGEPTAPVLNVAVWTTLRSIFVQAPISLVRDSLAATYQITSATDECILEVTTGADTIVLLLQPLNVKQTMIHGLMARETRGADRLASLRQQNACLTDSRDAIERAAALLNNGRAGH